jgi:hypothetical protein
MNKETLHFKIGLSGSSSTKHPQFAIFLNDKKFFDTVLTQGPNITEYFEFDADVEEGNCFLSIELKNKTILDTVLDKHGNIISDLLLNIDSIEIDEMDLGSLLWTESNYVPNYPESYKEKIAATGQALLESLQNCVNLGWNGKWTLPFQSPFYIWLLESI